MRSALSDASARIAPRHAVERWCNRVAPELLVPLDALRNVYDSGEPLRDALARLARQFKVGTLVVLRRLHDARRLNRAQFWAAYDAELERLRDRVPSTSGGGDYYRTTAARVSRRFARAVIAATWEGRSTFTEAFRLLGCRKASTLRELGHSVGMDV
jgi:Zn-dependent peptidase ImmA (M78 family)